MIGLTYSHTVYNKNAKLLPNYFFLLNNVFPDVEDNYDSIMEYVTNGSLKAILSDSTYTPLFDNPTAQQILAAAYPNTVLYKFAGERKKSDSSEEIDKEIITLCNSYFDIDYEAVLTEYAESNERKHIKAHFAERLRSGGENIYTDRNAVVEAYLAFVEKIMHAAGHAIYGASHTSFARSHLIIRDKPGTSGETSREGRNVVITLGNNTYTTLIHELLHFTNNFFEDSYERTLVSASHSDSAAHEGLANFIAYHLTDHIMQGDINLSTVPTDIRFYSFYIDIYTTLRAEGSTSKKENYAIVRRELEHFLGPDISDAIVSFYFERFYKYFRYDQHTYFYPKELIYHIGYHEMRESFRDATDRKQWLFEKFTGNH